MEEGGVPHSCATGDKMRSERPWGGDSRSMHTYRTCVTYLHISYELSVERVNSLYNPPTR